MNWFARLYLILWIALIATEVVAASTNWVTRDTMSELYWTAQRAYPITMRVVLTVGMVVLYVHLVKGGTIE